METYYDIKVGNCLSLRTEGGWFHEGIFHTTFNCNLEQMETIVGIFTGCHLTSWQVLDNDAPIFEFDGYIGALKHDMGPQRFSVTIAVHTEGTIDQLEPNPMFTMEEDTIEEDELPGKSTVESAHETLVNAIKNMNRIVDAYSCDRPFMYIPNADDQKFLDDLKVGW